MGGDDGTADIPDFCGQCSSSGVHDKWSSGSYYYYSSDSPKDSDGKHDNSSSSVMGESSANSSSSIDCSACPVSSATATPDNPEIPGYSSANIEIPEITDPDDEPVLIEETLPECTASNEGESYLMITENTVYYCIQGEWVSGIEDQVKLNCSKGSVIIGGADDNSSNVVVSGSFPDSIGIRREQVTIAGVAQKGPFRNGAVVKIIEMDSLARMKDSKRSMETCITSADGHYNFEGIDLYSPYVRMEVSGYYRSEFTGKMSNNVIQLDAVVDLTDKDTVNVNMLTHLEAPHVMHLLENTGGNAPVSQVKKQALSDILRAFEIDLGNGMGGSSFTNPGFVSPGFNFGFGKTADTEVKFAEDIDLFGDDEYSAALLAVSVMMQSFGSSADMMAYAAKIAEDIKGDGSWNDNNDKAALADRLVVLDSSGGLKAIRKNMEAWKLGPIPDFEKYIRNFWPKPYSLPTCNNTTAGTVTYISCSMSQFFANNFEHIDNTRVRFICDPNNLEWRIANDVEKDTAGFGLGEYDRQFRAGRVNIDRYYVYETSTKKWRPTNSEDILEFVDVADVYKNLQIDEKVVFVMRHAQRTDDTGKNGHLTEEGMAQSEGVGKKVPSSGGVYLGYSGYTRTKETCEYIAKGAGYTNVEPELMEGLDGDWYIKDQNKFGEYKSTAPTMMDVFSAYAYRGLYADAMYDLEERSEEFIKKHILNNQSKLKKVNFFISHDTMILPFTVYCTDKKVNLRYFETKTWVNYLGGVAVIVNSAGQVRYVPVKGIDSGTMIL